MYYDAEFFLNRKACDLLRKQTPTFGYNGFGEIVYYRTYSRLIKGDFDTVLGQEGWHDTVIRVINGIMSIRKDWYVKNGIQWREGYWQNYSERMAGSMFRMNWLPPGRGLWACGTDLIRERGAMALYNCSMTILAEDWVEDLCWMMDSLMYGVGVGFRPYRTGVQLTAPQGSYRYQIPDTREGWVESIRRLLNAFVMGGPLPIFDDSLIRPYGSPIKSFGGEASGPGPLKQLHQAIITLCTRYIDDDDYDEIALKTDFANLIGVCVVSGNVRRSAELGVCEIDDPIFMDLKDYNKHPYRKPFGWMSNNSAWLEKDSDFEHMDMIAQKNIRGHDLGYLNAINLKRGRLGKNDLVREDEAVGANPCAEIGLEDKEVCNVDDTLPTRCHDTKQWLEACGFATFYCSTVALLPTHQPATNRVVVRNRRIGVGLVDFTGWVYQIGVAKVISALKQGYRTVRAVNKHLADEAGVCESIRVTTVKPGGTTTKIAARTPGAGYPTFSYTIRRINIGVGTPVDRVLEGKVPFEDSVYTPNTRVYEYPILQGPAPPATEVSLYQQAMNVVLLQREWADNMVSNTLYFKPRWSKVLSDGTINHNNNVILKCGGALGASGIDAECRDKEIIRVVGVDKFKMVYKVATNTIDVYRFNANHEEDDIEDVLSYIAPLTKSVSLLPHSDVGIFPQMPEEGITEAEYNRRLAEIKPIDWKSFEGSDGEDEKYCVGDNCSMPVKE